METCLLAIWTFISSNAEDFANWWSVAEASRAFLLVVLAPLYWPMRAFWRWHLRKKRDARETDRHSETQDSFTELKRLIQQNSSDPDAPDPTDALKTLQAYDQQESAKALNAIEQGDPSLADVIFEKLIAEGEERIDSDRIQISLYAVQRGDLAYYSDTEKALDAYTKATELDPSNANAWNLLANVLTRTGDRKKAANTYLKVLELGSLVLDPALIAVVLSNLGKLAIRTGNLYDAADFLHRALVINERIARANGVASNLGDLGLVAAARGKFKTANQFFQSAKALNEKLENKKGVADQLGNLGNIAIRERKFDSATGFLNEAFCINQDLGDKLGMANQKRNLGAISSLRGDTETARSRTKEALKLYEGLGDKAGIAGSFSLQGNIALSLKHTKEAEKLHTRSLGIAREIHDNELVARELYHLGFVYQKMGETEKAHSFFTKAKSEFLRMGMNSLGNTVQLAIDDLNNEDSD